MLKEVKIKILNPIIKKPPEFETDGSAGLDLRAAIDKKLQIKPGETHLISTGISIYIENKSHAALILPRSGLGHKHGIVLGNLVGLIDADYQGELLVSCWNRGVKTFVIEPLDRIAQLIFITIDRPKLSLVESFELTERGEGGFGSSGKK